jgi:hypothetical protein
MFLVDKLKSSFQLFYSRHYDRYGISVSHMTTDMFRVVITIRSFPHSGALVYRINLEIYNPYTGAAEMFLCFEYCVV